MANQDPITLFEFQYKYDTEEACHKHLFKMKWPNGFVCPKCGHDRAYEIKTRKLPLYECSQCKHQTTVLVGTVFEKTRTSLRKWFWAIFLVAQDKRGVSARLISEQLGVCYVTAWTMLHKIRKAMAQRDAGYQLGGIVELDESFFGAPTVGGKRGRGTEKTQVLVGLSLNLKGQPQHLKMEVITDIKGKTLVEFAKRNMISGSIISSDMYRSYRILARHFDHEPQEFSAKENPDHLKWLHVIISNAKAFIKGTYHGLDSKHLQAYLGEYCYRFNRRMFKEQLFNRLVHCCVTSRVVTYPELIK